MFTKLTVCLCPLKLIFTNFKKNLNSSVQSLSCVRLFATPWMHHTRPPCPSPTPGSLLKLISIESVMPSNHLILCRHLLLPPSIFPSVRVFSNESAVRIRWPKYWSFSFNICPSREYSGLISFRMDWLRLLAVQSNIPLLSSDFKRLQFIFVTDIFNNCLPT